MKLGEKTRPSSRSELRHLVIYLMRAVGSVGRTGVTGGGERTGALHFTAMTGLDVWPAGRQSGHCDSVITVSV